VVKLFKIVGSPHEVSMLPKNMALFKICHTQIARANNLQNKKQINYIVEILEISQSSHSVQAIVKRTGSNAVVPNYAKSESAAVPVY
jgi:hypothetical protein